MKRRLGSLLLCLCMLLIVLTPVSVSAEGNGGSESVIPFPGEASGKVIGIAWRADTDSEFYTNIVTAIEEAGGVPVLLDQVCSADLSYDEEGNLTEGVDAMGALTEAAGKLVRTNTWHDSNAAEVIGDIDTVIFTGGEDISSSLFFDQVPWHGVVAEIDYNAERDVSDYLTMSYCLDHDLKVAGFCRGMQMLSVVSGGEIIQDIPAYYAEKGLPYNYEHRNNKATPDSYRDYAPHAVTIRRNSHVYDIYGAGTLEGCPSWHHQAVENVDNTRLKVTAFTETGGIRIIEAVERRDKTFAVGLQFHPEASLVKHLEGAENADQFMDYETALKFFLELVSEEAESAEEVPDAA